MNNKHPFVVSGVAAGVALLAAALNPLPGRSAATAACTRGLTTVQRDPRLLLPLTADGVALAGSAALRLEKPSTRPELLRADLAITDKERGTEAKVGCGVRVWRRRVVVYITLRAFAKDASLSERVDFVGRFPDGYHVWQVVH